jgi:hypothetical protein
VVAVELPDSLRICAARLGFEVWKIPRLLPGNAAADTYA